MSQHTPGPWTYVQAGDGKRRPWKWAIVPSDQNRYGRIANVFNEDNHGEANARLIAAAPDMHAKLQRDEESCDHLDDSRCNRALLARIDGGDR